VGASQNMPNRKGRRSPVARDRRSDTGGTSDQAPGEESVQVNDAYSGGGPAPDEEATDSTLEGQHPTGG